MHFEKPLQLHKVPRSLLTALARPTLSGLIAYMAQLGSFVPAERAVVGVTDRLFTRIQTNDRCGA